MQVWIGGQRKHVHMPPQLLQFFLLRHAESLFLVYDEQSEILERDIFRREAVRSDDDVHLAGFKPFDRRFLFLRGLESAQHFDADGIVRHAFREGGEMLLRQHGGRHEHSDLARVHDRFERGADGHFRLAEAHVAAHQPVHDLRRLHVRFDFGDGAGLIGRLVVFE